MTRIETALASAMPWASDPKMRAREMVTTPTGQALAALVEALAVWDATDLTSQLDEAWDAFRAATEPPAALGPAEGSGMMENNLPYVESDGLPR